MVKWCAQNLRRNGSISRGTSHATSTKCYQYNTFVDINNTRFKRIQSLIQNYMPVCAVSLLESREQRYIKAMNNNDNRPTVRNLHVQTVVMLPVAHDSVECGAVSPRWAVVIRISSQQNVEE